MSFSVKESFIDRYVQFEGRARRKEYWLMQLFYYIGGFITVFFASFLGDAGGVLVSLYSLILLAPMLAVTSRRLHDIGKSFWWILIFLVPLIGWLVLLIFSLLSGDEGKNEYGDDPKALVQ